MPPDESKESKPAEMTVIICKQCHQSFIVPMKLPVLMCPWCHTPNFS